MGQTSTGEMVAAKVKNGLQGFFAYLVVGGVHLGDKLLPAVRQAQEKGTQLLLGAGGSPP